VRRLNFFLVLSDTVFAHTNTKMSGAPYLLKLGRKLYSLETYHMEGFCLCGWGAGCRHKTQYAYQNRTLDFFVSCLLKGTGSPDIIQIQNVMPNVVFLK
jgi:hypothetical protein